MIQNSMIVGWLHDFNKCVTKKDTKYTHVLAHVAMLGVNDPNFKDEDGLTKEQILLLNKTAHKILIKNNMVEKVRRALRDDLKTGDDEFGNIVLKEWGREALNNFFVVDAAWTK